MSRSVEPIPPVERERRRKARRAQDQVAGAPPPAINLPCVVAVDPAPDRPEAKGSAIFAAQLLGQPGQKRGLRGGPETLEKARAAYLEAEWSGPLDRRNLSGRTTNADI